MSEAPSTTPAGGEVAAAQPQQQPQQQQSPAPTKRKKHSEDFIFGETLGHGSFGDVVKGIDKETGKEYAIKIMDKMLMVRQGKKKYVITERDILSKCNHPNIVKLSYTFQSETSLRKQLRFLYTYFPKYKTFEIHTSTQKNAIFSIIFIHYWNYFIYLHY